MAWAMSMIDTPFLPNLLNTVIWLVEPPRYGTRQRDELSSPLIIAQTSKDMERFGNTDKNSGKLGVYQVSIRSALVRSSSISQEKTLTFANVVAKLYVYQNTFAARNIEKCLHDK